MAGVIAVHEEAGFAVYDVVDLSYRPLDGALAQADVLFAPENGTLRRRRAYADDAAAEGRDPALRELFEAPPASAPEMKVSLALPTLNMGDTIAQAVSSVLDQSHEDVELLVQDANSDDGTSDALAAFGDARVDVVREPDDGQADAVNRALARATGEIFGWLNADDELTPGSLARIVSVFEQEPRSSSCTGAAATSTGPGRPLRPYDVRPFDRRLLLTRDYLLQPATFWRRSLWDRVGPLDTTLNWGFDWDWFIRASRVTSFRYLDEELARYRLTGENKSLVGGDARQAELAVDRPPSRRVRQPTYLYWRFTRLRRAVPLVAPLEPLLWRLFPGRIMC